MAFFDTIASAFKGKGARVPLSQSFGSSWAYGEGSGGRRPFIYQQAVKHAYVDNPVAHRAVRLVADGLGGAPLCPTDPALHGNAYIQILKDGLGRPIELYALRPERVSLVFGNDGWPTGISYRVGERVMTIPMLDGDASPNIIHIKGYHPTDDHYGAGCLAAADMAVTTHNAAANWNRALLENAARPSGALIYDPGAGAGLSPEQFDRLRDVSVVRTFGTNCGVD